MLAEAAADARVTIAVDGPVAALMLNRPGQGNTIDLRVFLKRPSERGE